MTLELLREMEDGENVDSDAVNVDDRVEDVDQESTNTETRKKMSDRVHQDDPSDESILKMRKVTLPEMKG